MSKRTLKTHREWCAETRRLLGASRVPKSRIIADYERLVERVRRAIPLGVNEWHLAQTWHLLSLQQAAAGEHDSAADTLLRLANHHRALLVEHQRAYVAGAAAAAVQLFKAGDGAAARRLVRRAECVSHGLKPQEQLLRQAKAIVAARSGNRSRTLANKRVESAAASIRRRMGATGRRGSRAGR